LGFLGDFKNMKAAILAVGTELTSGQIINRNASWISEKLKGFGLLTELHLTIPDNRQLILECLNTCAKHADLIFVTGGLGPTSDDFTREVVSAWAQQPLEFHDLSWQHLNERLSARGYQVTDIQRQQCYFPKTARILKNSQGTANAFFIQYQSKRVYVLPGPPKEIEAIWNDILSAEFKSLTEHIDRHLTLSWDTMGFGESQIAEKVEKIAGQSGFEIGYRVHLPYVEVKFSFLASQKLKAQSYIDQIDQVLSDCTIVKNGDEVLKNLVTQLAEFDRIEIYDSASNSILTTKLAAHVRNFNSWMFTSEVIPKIFSGDEKVVQLSMSSVSDSEVHVLFRTKNIEKTANFSSQLNANMNERKLQIFTERAFIFWSQELRNKK
jgi:nicotinamide-nucleotide amidase